MIRILMILQIIIQIYFAVHAVKTGRSSLWLWIIVLFPMIGWMIYFFAEYLPDLQRKLKVRKRRSKVKAKVTPINRLRYLQDQVTLSPSLANKKLLAAEYVNLGLFDRAIALYETCMEGPYENDTTIIEGL